MEWGGLGIGGERGGKGYRGKGHLESGKPICQFRAGCSRKSTPSCPQFQRRTVGCDSSHPTTLGDQGLRSVGFNPALPQLPRPWTTGTSANDSQFGNTLSCTWRVVRLPGVEQMGRGGEEGQSFNLSDLSLTRPDIVWVFNSPTSHFCAQHLGSTCSPLPWSPLPPSQVD